MLLSYLLIYELTSFKMWVIPQDILITKFIKKIYSLKVAHPATKVSSHYQGQYLTISCKSVICYFLWMNIWSLFTTMLSNKCWVFAKPALYLLESRGKSFHGIIGTRSRSSLHFFGFPKLPSATQWAAQKRYLVKVICYAWPTKYRKRILLQSFWD